MSKMQEIYEQAQEGKKFKTVSDILGESLNIRSDLVGRNKAMQELTKKHSKYFKRISCSFIQRRGYENVRL